MTTWTGPWSVQRREAAVRVTWPLVALISICLTFFYFIFRAGDPVARSALIGLLITSTSALVTVLVQRLRTDVKALQKKLGGSDDPDHQP